MNRNSILAASVLAARRLLLIMTLTCLGSTLLAQSTPRQLTQARQASDAMTSGSGDSGGALRSSHHKEPHVADHYVPLIAQWLGPSDDAMEPEWGEALVSDTGVSGASSEIRTHQVAGSFPALPPDPRDHLEQLPDLQEELWHHSGGTLYPSESHVASPSADSHEEPLRLPKDWLAPEPWTLFADFLGADPIQASRKSWWGPGEYSWEPRFVASGSWEFFGFAVEQAGRRQDAIGQNGIIDLDLRLTGTERFHVQFRPLGRRNSGGSFYQFSDPNGYVSNATAEPDRFWFEGEIHSLFGWGNDYFAQRYYNITAGKFPLIFHNSLLLNDEVIGAVVSQNNIVFRNWSNLNIQWFAGVNDVDTFAFTESRVYGAHAAVDFKRVFFETTYAFLDADGGRSSHYLGASRTKFFGPFSLATRGFAKFGDESGTGSGQLVTVETNWTRVFDHAPLAIHHGVFFCNAFWASDGWNSISGGNLNRLRTAFEVDPLVRLSAGPVQQGTVGVALGVQLFRHHEDESLVPEFAWEAPDGTSVFGFGLKYQRKLTARSFLDVLGVVNWSDERQFRRDGIFVSHRWIF